MNLNEAKNLALDLIEQHCPDHELVIKTSKRSLASCHWARENGRYRKMIKLSKEYVELNSREHVTEVIKHEIAHAWTYKKCMLQGKTKRADFGHTKQWRHYARMLGVKNISSRDKTANMPKGKYSGTCPCGDTWERYRLSQAIRNNGQCPKCREKITWKKNY